MRAFAIAAADVRDAGGAVPLLARPAYPGEYDFLAIEWPELHAFLAAHSLSARS